MKLELPCSIFQNMLHTLAEHSVRFCLINLLNKDTSSTTIMERVHSDPFKALNFTWKDKYWGNTKMTVSLLTVTFAVDLKLMICS